MATTPAGSTHEDANDDATGQEVDLSRFEAVLFDLDGVLTDTASLHAQAWKHMFDDFLERWSTDHDRAFVPFRIDPDYLRHVDGKPRLEGVASFLESRRIVLPDGSPDDPPDEDTIHGLATAKNVLLLRLIDEQGVESFPSSLRWVEQVRDAGLAVAIVTSSRNADQVMAAAGIDHLFTVRVDGVVAEELNLSGKPDPATFLEAARRLGVEPGRTIVVEDAVAGVQAGRLGNFGHVIGVDREGDPERLREAGADTVVDDLGALVTD